MNHNTNSTPKLDLKLQLTPPRPTPLVESPNRSVSSMDMSTPRSCLSSELSQDETLRYSYSSSPETPSMMLAGCPRCLMYVMLSEEDPKCPKCKSTVLLDLLNVERTKKTEI
uniref:GIR1-like zinc ribbon domain-containing protein n=1 Tax=Davidia involucrata TaxID=16924 RepID=A0A5B7BWQ5_DAVIN